MPNLRRPGTDMNANESHVEMFWKLSEKKRSPIVLTELNDHLLYLEKRFFSVVKNIAVFCVGLRRLS